MANLFGANIESPAETQRRLLEEQLAKQRSLGQQSAAGQVGSALGKALSNMFGAEAKQRRTATERQEAANAGKLVEEQLVKQGVDPFDAQLKARAHTIAILRERGDFETANAIQENTQKWMEDYKLHKAQMNQLKATTESSEQQTKESKQREFLSKTEGQITADLSRVNGLMAGVPESERGSKTYQELQRRQLVNVERLQDLREEQERNKSWSITDVTKQGPDGKTYTQRVAVNTEDPSEMINLGDPLENVKPLSSISQKRIIDHNDTYRIANEKVANYSTMLEELGTLDDAGGLARLGEYTKDVLGVQDPESYLRLQLRKMRVSDAIQNLPPGVASDKDIELVLSGTLPEGASPAMIREYLTAMRNVEEAAARYSKFAANHISENGTEAGLIPAWEVEQKKMNEEREVIALQQKAEQEQQLAARQQATNRAAEIVGQIEQLQTAMANPQFPASARESYNQQLLKLSQELAALQQGGGQQSAPQEDYRQLAGEILSR